MRWTGMDRTHYVHSWMDLRNYKCLLFSMLARHRDHHSDHHDSAGHDEYATRHDKYAARHDDYHGDAPDRLESIKRIHWNRL